MTLPPIIPYVSWNTNTLGEKALITNANDARIEPAIPTGRIPSLLLRAATMGPEKRQAHD